VTGVAGTRGLVFGASSGIGGAVAALAAEQGGHVLAFSRRGTAPSGVRITALRGDVRDPADVDRAFRAAQDHGGLDWVVNAAGVGFFAPVEERFAQQWQDILNTSVLGTLNILARASTLHPSLSHFVQIGSLAGARPSQTPGNDVYSAAKAAVALLLRRHRARLRVKGILTRVTLVTPGYVGGTDFGRNFFAHAPDQKVPILDRFEPLSAADIAEAVYYALTRPYHLELSEIVIRPVEQPD
jgi:NADP-dependent 3-hydroxy acid dehydrogenase YdfG